MAKPVAVVNTSPRAHHAYEALLETLRTMSASVIADASVVVPLLGSCTTEAQMLGSPEVAGQIRAILEGIRAAQACVAANP